MLKEIHNEKNNYTSSFNSNEKLIPERHNLYLIDANMRKVLSKSINQYLVKCTLNEKLFITSYWYEKNVLVLTSLDRFLIIIIRIIFVR